MLYLVRLDHMYSMDPGYSGCGMRQRINKHNKIVT